jgi:hypothetical protein
LAKKRTWAGIAEGLPDISTHRHSRSMAERGHTRCCDAAIRTEENWQRAKQMLSTTAFTDSEFVEMCAYSFANVQYLNVRGHGEICHRAGECRIPI